MSSFSDKVYYCCVWRDSKFLYTYGEDQETIKLASLCLEKVPSHHKWYFQTMFKKTFGFLIDDGYVYFAIIDENIGSYGGLGFLECVRDEFKKYAKKGSKKNGGSVNLVLVQKQLGTAVRRLVASLEVVNESNVGSECKSLASPYNGSDNNGQSDGGASTKAPLLGKSSKHEKKKTRDRDHVISVRENGVGEDHRKSADKGGAKVDSSSVDPDNQGGGTADGIVSKEVSSVSRSTTQSIRNKWCRQVRIVLAIDVAVCLILFIVWIVVCRGTECIR